MIKNLFILLGLSLIISCAPSIKKEYISKIEPIPAEYNITDNLPSGKPSNRSICNDKLNYIPDPDHLEFIPVKVIKCNFHIMRSSDGKQNFPNKDMGKAFVKKMLESTNQKLNSNAKMFLPLHNDTPVLPMCYQFELTPKPYDPEDDGIYFHDDDELFYINNRGKSPNIYKQGVYKKYGIQKDTVLNVFIMGFHPDSLKSPTYKISNNGIAFGKWLKLASNYYFMKDTSWHEGKEIPFEDHWSGQRLLNHEIGHCLGLRHSWSGNDGCDDTPNHPNCWNYTKDGSKCDSIISNNIMDYSAHVGAWTPCQIGTIHFNLSNKSNRMRNLVKKTWCHFDSSKTIIIQAGEDIVWNGAKDLEGNIIVKNDASLTIHCRVSLPVGAKIIVEPKGKLILNGATLENDCGEQWKGIEVWSERDQKGLVQIINDAKIVNVENEVETILE